MASDEREVKGNIKIEGDVSAGSAIGHGANVKAGIIVGGDAMIVITAQQPLRLREDRFKFLCWVYVKANGSYFHRVIPGDIATELKLTESEIVRASQYLADKDLVHFQTLAEGIRLTHRGVVVTEFVLSEQGALSDYLSQEVREQILARKSSRYEFLHRLYEKAQGDPNKMVLKAELSNSLEIDDHQVVATITPYLDNEGWIRIRTNDSVAITEAGIEKVKSKGFDS
jgi:Mn-dependent DtxR family transcriptional regulator